MNIRYVLILVFIGAAIFFLSSLTTLQHNSTSNNKIEIATSFYPLYFFATQIGGYKVDVKNITPAGAEPHDYEPTAQDIAYMEKSKLLILNGEKLESWGDKIKENLTNTKVIEVANGLANQQLDEDGKIIRDPHVWLSPRLAEIEVEKILAGFIQIDPNNREYYQSKAANLIAELNRLDGQYKQSLANCSVRNFVTSHAAFGYLASAYDLHQIAISGLSPDEEPSLKQLTKITQFVRSHQIKYIFFESLVSPKLAETLAQEVDAKSLVLDPIEGVTNEEMKNGKNYLTIMKDNLINLQIALECK